jgi:mannose-1-phosphate guanylyltransferase
MNEATRSRIRHIFLSPRPTFALMSAASLLGMTLNELKRKIEEGSIVAVSTTLGQRLTREETIAAAMQIWEQLIIEDALGQDAATVLPEAIRLVELRARVPRYQWEMLRYLAQRHGTSVDDVLTRELEDVACAHSDELAEAVPGFDLALVWP